MNILEWIAALFITASVVMLGKANILGWIFSVVGCLMYGVVFLEQKLYANALLQIVFVLQGVYGIFQWKKIDSSKEFISLKFDYISLLLIFSITLGTSILISAFIYSFMPGEYPFTDTLLSVCGLFATIMLIKKVIHAWFFWMAIDIGYVYLFLKIDMHISAGLYMLLFLLCIKNYMQWNKKIEHKTI